MNWIRKFFLRAKHWQIFLLFVGANFVWIVATMSFVSTTWLSPQDFVKSQTLLGVLTALFILWFLAWFWSMGSFLSSLAPPELRPNAVFFLFAVTYPALYCLAILPFFPSLLPGWFVFILPLHFLAMFCMFYDLYFVAKSLVLVETGKPATFYDYAGPFFLLWFFPIGVWFTQPRINRLYEQFAPSHLKEGRPATEYH